MTIEEASSDESIRREKAVLRAQFRAWRQEMPESHWSARSAAICQQLGALPEVQQAATIHSFWPLAARHEPDLRPLLYAWHAAGKTIVLPRVAGLDPPRLAHHVWQPGGALVRGAWGVDEPEETWTTAAATPDLVLVPALAVDARGYRLGYGKGFYDAFLDTTSAPRLVPLYDTAVVKWLPHEAHDLPVHLAVTETRVLRFT